MTFCTDADLLHWEPKLFVDAAAAGQVLLNGLGDLSGASFTVASLSFVTAKVEVNQVIALSGAFEGSFPIIAVNSATVLTLSVLYDALYGDDGSIGAGIPTPATFSDVTFAIRTFGPQRRVVSDLLKAAAGLGPTSDANTAAGTILNPLALRRACALGTLQMIYSALAAVIPSDGTKDLVARAALYGKLYRQAIGAAKVEVDLDGDGKADEVRPLSVVKLVRV